MNDRVLATDLTGLPKATKDFVLAMCDFGFGRAQIHGFFVLIGLYAGAPRPEPEIKALFKALDIVIPVDRTENVDDRVGHFYNGYEQILGEFCYRSGQNFEFRTIDSIEDVKLAHVLTILELENHNILDDSIENIGKLLDSSRLYWSLITELGALTLNNNRPLTDAFSCGIFQTQLLCQFDVNGTHQVSALLKTYLPIFLGELFQTMEHNQLDYCSQLNQSQIPLLKLMRPMDGVYARDMWGFQSWLFYENQKPIAEVEHYDAIQWHKWVVKTALKYSNTYPSDLKAFSQSGLMTHGGLNGIPLWSDEVSEFNLCNEFIKEIWGYDVSDLRNPIELLEYKALVTHTVYSSLTSSREQMH